MSAESDTAAATAAAPRRAKHRRSRKTLGQILREKEWAADQQIEDCADEAKREGKVIGSVLVAHGYITEDQLVHALAEQAGMAVVDLDAIDVPRDVVDRVSVSIAEVYKIAPVKFEEGVLTVAMADPLQVQALDDLRFMLNCEVEGVVASEAAVERAVKKYYAGQRESVEQIIQEIQDSRDEEAEPARVPWHPFREALRAGIDLVADVLVLHGAELPWGRGKPRLPRNRNEFDGISRFLRDLPAGEDRPPLGALFESARLPALPHKERVPHRVTFYRGRQVLSVDGARIALPAGRELELLELLAQRRGRGEVTPPAEGGTDWKNAADQLRRRIRRATGEKLFHAVVVGASAPVGGYRLAPGVRVRDD